MKRTAATPVCPRVSMRPPTRIVQGVLLALLSVATGLAACEAALRLFHPRYELAAAPPEGPSGRMHQRADPDTDVTHAVIYNNLDSRQSRDFPAGNLETAVNIAFFGDSETENLLIPAQYSYTEPLDYLLNAAARGSVGASEGTAFNVLNFGVWGWGPGRSYFRWRKSPVRRKLAHVFYMVVGNDLGDLRGAVRAGIVRIGESGEIREGGPPRTPAWKRALARLHLTYLVVDAWQRLASEPPSHADAGAVDRRRGSELSRGREWPVFRELVRRWKREVEEDGGAFHVVLTPKETRLLRLLRGDAALRAEVDVVDLLECFREAVPKFDYADWRFVRNEHWNAAGNMLAASCLYRHLEDVLGLRKRGHEELARARHAYYKAFLDSPVWLGQRYMPDATWARPPGRGGEPPGAREHGGEVVAKYLALEFAPMDDRWHGAVRAARAAGPVATSAWDVYANPRERLLVYVKSACPAAIPASERIFLHVVPFTPEKLPADRQGLGFVNLDTGPFSPLLRKGSECVFSAHLPDYPLSAVRTGRYTLGREGADVVYTNLWSARFQMPLARGVWDVAASAAGRGLDYVRKSCAPADTKARFFLHVFPLRPADLRGRPASGVLRRYANLDFAWGETGVETGGACRISVALPDYPIDFVRTGQFRDGIVFAKRLWSARIDFAEVERAGPRLGGDGAASGEARTGGEALGG